MNLVFLNGAIIPANEARISLFDRGFLYGDGLFETIRIQAGRPFRWAQHLARLEQGLKLTGIQLSESVEALARPATELIAANQCMDGVLRITVSRGPGRRGYSPRGAGPPTVAMSLHPRSAPSSTPAALRLVVSTIRLLADDPLGAVKTANKLHHIMARAEAEAAGADDAILLNHRGELAETTSSNLFWIEQAVLQTPPRTAGLLPGVARGVLLELASTLGLDARESAVGLDALGLADGVFVANTVSGPVEVLSIAGRVVPRWERFGEMRRIFESLVQHEVEGTG